MGDAVSAFLSQLNSKLSPIGRCYSWMGDQCLIQTAETFLQTKILLKQHNRILSRTVVQFPIAHESFKCSIVLECQVAAI